MKKLLSMMQLSNLRKTWYYLKKNGVSQAYYGVRERLEQASETPYIYPAVGISDLVSQRVFYDESIKDNPDQMICYSILVPAYETKVVYLREMIASVLAQSYGNFQLIIADASKTDGVEKVLKEYEDARIVYLKLDGNKGIAENTNKALELAMGEYVALLDHDDVLTPDALFEINEAIIKGQNDKQNPLLVYSDEDKTDETCSQFYEPHFKPDFDPELLLSNNYICHFLVMERRLFQELRLRGAYNGAQDYDLVLRAAGKLWFDQRIKNAIVHVPKVLYHWRCHKDSTAENPASKGYAYEAGKMALVEFLQQRGWKGQVKDTAHLGFYQVMYEPHIFSVRKEVGIIGGKIVDKNGKIDSGILDASGNPVNKGLHKRYSGYMHRAVLQQKAVAVDLQCMKVRKELWQLFEESIGVPYEEDESGFFAWKKAVPVIGYDTKARIQYRVNTLLFCKKAQESGYDIVWQPMYVRQLKKGS